MTTLLKRKHVLAASARSYGSIVRSDGASNYWPLDETSGLVATDVIGGKNGTISGGVTLNQPGAIGKAMAFNGTTGKIITTAPIALLTPFTIESWLRVTTGNESPIFGTRNAPADGGQLIMQLAAASGGSVYCFVSGLGGTSTTPTPPMNDGLWHHVVMIIDGTATVLFYIDGTLRPVGPLTGVYGVGSSAHVLEIGHDSAGPTFWPGTLQAITIYPRILTPVQIANHFALR